MRLLAVECPLCKENTLYTFILKIVLVTIYATYIVKKILIARPTPPLSCISDSTLIGAKKCAKVENYA